MYLGNECVAFIDRRSRIRHEDGGDGYLTGERPNMEVFDGLDTIEFLDSHSHLLRFDGALLEEDRATFSQQE